MVLARGGRGAGEDEMDVRLSGIVGSDGLNGLYIPGTPYCKQYLYAVLRAGTNINSMVASCCIDWILSNADTSKYSVLNTWYLVLLCKVNI